MSNHKNDHFNIDLTALSFMQTLMIFLNQYVF